MAQPSKKAFSQDQAPDAREPGAPNATGATPLAFWSNMAEMQRQYLSTLMQSVGDAASRDNVTNIRPKPVAAPAAIGQNWIAAATEVQREVANFMTDRLSKNQAFLASAMSAPGLPELVQLQAGWMTQTTQDYTTEFGKLSNIVKNGADEAIAVTA